jgi:hypothetical protein
MGAELPPHQLDYLAPTTKRRWSRRRIVSVICLAGLVVLFYAGMCIMFVASNTHDR